jgi:hypothetical protein
MRSFRPTFFCTPFLLTCSMVFGETQCPGPGNVVPVQYHPLPHSHIGISVTVNGSGPYEFMVDTGAQITVIDPALDQELKLKAAGSLNIVTVASNVEVPLVSTTVVEVGPVSVHDMQMAVEDLGSIHEEYPKLRGILGNNFLSHFDLLIDNSHKILCFDQSRRIQQSLRGERIPILSGAASASNSASADAILVSVHVPDSGKQGSVLRLDSGSNVPILYVDHQARTSSRGGQGYTIGKQAQFVYAYTPERNVRFSTQVEKQISFATPAANSRLFSKIGEDGVLPTALFKRVFISAADHFVMFDPQ